jgi:hypothetical protein
MFRLLALALYLTLTVFSTGTTAICIYLTRPVELQIGSAYFMGSTL